VSTPNQLQYIQAYLQANVLPQTKNMLFLRLLKKRPVRKRLSPSFIQFHLPRPAVIM
jgi:hypothetical protein